MFEDKQQPLLTPIAKLGEFGLIKHITEQFSVENSTTALGAGDDAAVVAPHGGQVVISTDMFTEGVHFNLGYAPLKHLGYKTIVAGISDITAMNAVPSQVLVSLAVSNRFPVEAVEELYQGIALACKRYKVDLIGGILPALKQGWLSISLP